MRSSATIVAAVLMGATLSAAAFMSGCQSDPEPVGMTGGTALTATYSLGTLTTDVVRGGIGVREVASAAEAVFRRRGYTLRTAKVTGDTARVTAQEPGEGEFRATVVTANQIDGGVRIEVHVEPFGDHERSRVMMNDLLGRLGM